MEILEALLLPLFALAYFVGCQALRSFLGRLLAPRLFLQLGLGGHANAVGSLVPRATMTWLRNDLNIRRDWLWLSTLAVYTTLLAAIPFAGFSGLKIEAAPASLTLLYLAGALLGAALCFQGKQKANYRQLTRQVFRGIVGAAALLLLLLAVFYSFRFSSLEDLTKEVWLIARSPLMAGLFICGWLVSPVFQIQIPDTGAGEGPARLLTVLSECFWMTLLVTIFFSGGLKPAPIGAMDVAIKTALLLFLKDFLASFFPGFRSFEAERKVLSWMFPLMVLFSIALVWRRFVG